MSRPVGITPGGLWRICALLLLAGCATPEVLTAPAIEASMPRDTTSLPVTAIAEPTGDAPISLPEPTPPAMPRSGPAATP